MIYLNLFIEFFKVGLFSIGGGLATLPFLFDLSDKYPWFSQGELLDMIAISESTPGAIGVNIASYAGYKSAGFLGAIVSTFALVLPAFLIIIVIARFLTTYKENKILSYMLSGLRPASISLILSSILSVASLTFLGRATNSSLSFYIEWKLIFFFAFLFLLINKFKNFHPILFILIGGLIGYILKL